jgi:hypothetical protein
MYRKPSIVHSNSHFKAKKKDLTRNLKKEVLVNENINKSFTSNYKSKIPKYVK